MVYTKLTEVTKPLCDKLTVGNEKHRKTSDKSAKSLVNTLGTIFAWLLAMENSQQSPAPVSETSAPEASGKPARRSKPHPPLPSDMQGWLSTKESAAIMGLPDRKFRHYAARHHLPKRAVGVPVYYDPAVIADAVRKMQEAEKTPPRQSSFAPKQTGASSPVPNTVHPAASAGTDFHIQALAALTLIVQKQSQTQR